MPALSYLVGSVTQGGADAFAIAEVATALSGQTGLAFRVREIMLELPRIAGSSAVAVEVALARRTKAAMPLITDRDVILKHTNRAELTTSGTYLIDATPRYVWGADDDLLIVEDPLFFMIDSNGTSLTSSAYIRVGYTTEKISAVDRLTLLTQSLEG